LALSDSGQRHTGAHALAGASGARSCDRYASPGGRDSARGSSRRPYRSVYRLLRSLGPGRVGCLKRGTWSEDVEVSRGGRPGDPITLRNAPGAHPEIQGVFTVTRSAHDVVIRGLRLNGANGGETPSPQINAERITFSRNRVTNHHRAICFTLGGEDENYGEARDVRLLNNRIYDCGRLPATGHDHGIYLEGSVGAVIRGNLIHDNADWGVHLYPDARATLVAGNVINNNGGGVIFAGEGDEASSDNLVTGNVISNSVNTYNLESWWGGAVGTGNVATKNCLWGGAEGNIAEEVGFTAYDNLVAPPKFVNEEGGDLRVHSGTACARRIAAGSHVGRAAGPAARRIIALGG
jgi:parallel beta-helix repeat protein